MFWSQIGFVIPVLGILAFWNLSEHWSTGITIRILSVGEVSIGQSYSRMTFTFSTESSGAKSVEMLHLLAEEPEGIQELLKHYGGTEFFPLPAFPSIGSAGGPSVRVLCLPHWIILLALVLSWIGFLRHKFRVSEQE